MVFSSLSSKCFYRKNKTVILYIVGVILAFLAAAVFSSLAGARDIGVGTDTAFYGVHTFTYAKDNTFSLFRIQFDNFTFFAQCVFFLPGHYIKIKFWHFFIINIIYTLPVIISCLITMKDYSPSGVFVFGVFLFPMSMNAMKQAMAMGFVALAIAFTLKRKVIPFIVCAVVATLFHDTAIIALIIYPIYYYLTKETYLPVFIKAFIIIFASLLVWVSLGFFVQLLSGIPRFSQYMEPTKKPTGGFFTIYLVCMVSILLILAVVINNKQKFTKELSLIFILLIVSTVMFAFALKFDWVGRLSFYFWMAYIFVPYYIVERCPKKPDKLLFTTIILAILLTTGVLYNIIRPSDGVQEYRFDTDFNMKVESSWHYL